MTEHVFSLLELSGKLQCQCPMLSAFAIPIDHRKIAIQGALPQAIGSFADLKEIFFLKTQ